MTTLGNPTIDHLTPEVGDRARLTTWYAQGHSDGLGDRLLMFDNTSAPSWEILRFTPTLARNPRFEAAVLDGVEQLRSFSHPAFPVVRSAGDLDGKVGLAVVSTYIAGVLLSEAAKKPRTAGLALRVVRQLAPALATLHEHGPGISHGVLTPDRIVLAAGGRLIIREHMVGRAVNTLGLSAPELWASFGALRPPIHDRATQDEGVSDITQLALVAISLMAGRRIGPEVYPGRIGAWLEGIALRESRNNPDVFPPFRTWLERALHISQPFESARQASDLLASWCSEPSDDGHAEGTQRRLIPTSGGNHMQRAGVPMPDAGLVPTNGPDSSNASFAVPSTRRGQLIRWAAIAAAVLAVSEAVLIGRLVYGRTAWSPPKTMVRAMEPKTGSVVDAGGPSAPAPAANDRQDRASAQRLSAVAAALDRAIAPTVDTTQAPMAAAPRRGGFRISSAIELHVLDGERLVGSSGDGPIITTAGSREFEFVNSAIGYRLRRTVDIKAGQITPISVTVPNGSLNINATPWAEVWIDGTPYGQTPLGNVSISPGEHLIRFRHPQLGERWERTIVRSDMPARVSVNLQR